MDLHETRLDELGLTLPASSTLNDLYVLLGRALSERKPVTLQRAEARAENG
jgi:hypothetical protein